MSVIYQEKVQIRWPQFAGHVTASLSARLNVAFISKWIEQGFLAIKLPVRKSLARIRKLNWLSNNLELLTQTPGTLQIRFTELVAHMGLPGTTKVDIVETLLRSGDQQVKEAALWLLFTIHAAEADRDLRVQVGA